MDILLIAALVIAGAAFALSRPVSTGVRSSVAASQARAAAAVMAPAKPVPLPTRTPETKPPITLEQYMGLIYGSSDPYADLPASVYDVPKGQSCFGWVLRCEDIGYKPGAPWGAWSGAQKLAGTGTIGAGSLGTGSRPMPFQYRLNKPGRGRWSDGPSADGEGQIVASGAMPPLIMVKSAPGIGGFQAQSVVPDLNATIGPARYFSGWVRLATPGWIRTFKWVRLGDYLVPVGASDSFNPQQSFIQSMVLPVVESGAGMLAAFFSGGAAIALFGFNQLITYSGVITTPADHLVLSLCEKEAAAQL